MSMYAALRSVFVANRSSLTGTAVVVALAAALLTASGTWLDAGIRDERLGLVVGLAGSFAGIVVMITVFIVASVFAGALRERRNEFALLRAVGATARQVRATVTAEALAILLVAGPVGAAVGILVAPRLVPLLRSGAALPDGFVLPFSPISILVALLVLLPTALLAARTAARGVLRVSPTAAVRESTVDAPTISLGRLRTAAVLGVVGLLAATTPFFVPGVIGSATGATSAILLVIAAGLAGPVLVHRVATRGMTVLGNRAGAGRVLAFANARGFSRRLSAAVIPLALLLALGSVQSGVNSGVVRATATELRAGAQADLIVLSPSGVTSYQAAAIAALPGVTASAATGHLAASVRTDPEVGWEPTTMGTITPGSAIRAGRTLLDPTVSSGSLRDLDAAGTIAVSRTALLFTGKRVGDTVDVRLGGVDAGAAKIVAVYERGLGFGDYLMGVAAAERGPAAAAFDAVFVDTTASTRVATRQALAEMGLTVTDGAGYASVATKEAGGQQQPSLVLLLALLGFVGAAAANTLAMSTASRRDEFALLRRIGATRAQVMRMVTIETAFIIATALTIGLLAVLPALIGVGQGLLGAPFPVFDLSVTVALVVATVAIAILTVIPTAWRATSTSSSRVSV
ncbi:ABC transporter permease [Lapillicoccus sp.]|uniref:FtsX-like permease family protein n=1 Tax=Lapillicoccus sp. TaxID=1909287 RepID=UPI0025CCA224|nr:ABC transporter permease [Lapillicoccus sp.]